MSLVSQVRRKAVERETQTPAPEVAETKPEGLDGFAIRNDGHKMPRVQIQAVNSKAWAVWPWNRVILVDAKGQGRTIKANRAQAPVRKIQWDRGNANSSSLRENGRPNRK